MNYINPFLDVGPVYHWNERRVRGHIFVLVLAYLFEQEMQVLYRRQWARDKVAAESLAWVEDRSKALAELESRWYTGEAIVRELRRWKAVRATFLDKEFVSVTKAKDSAKVILASLGIPTPNKTLSVTKASSTTRTE